MEILAGLVTALAIVGLGYATRQGRSLPFYSSVLIFIALAYVLFAVMNGTPRMIIVESAITIVFIAVAVMGARRSNLRAAGLLMAEGLTGHGVYDLFHSLVVTNPIVPAWWPPVLRHRRYRSRRMGALSAETWTSDGTSIGGGV